MNAAIFILLLLLCVGCAAERSELGARSSKMEEPKALATVQNQSGVLPSPFHRGVTWDYSESMPAENVAFDLEASTNLTEWQLIQTTNQPPALWDSFNQTEYVRVGAHWITP